jgi:hypothetical protein
MGSFLKVKRKYRQSDPQTWNGAQELGGLCHNGGMNAETVIEPHAHTYVTQLCLGFSNLDRGSPGP